MPIRKVKEITREKESQFVAHPSPCHSQQGTNVTDGSAASPGQRGEILDNEWTLDSIHLNSEPITAAAALRNKSSWAEGG